MALAESFIYHKINDYKISFALFLYLDLYYYPEKQQLYTNMVNIGEHIIRLRKAKGWSQDKLAKEVGSSRIMIGNYERGENLPSVEMIIKLARIFDVSIDFLLGEGQLSSLDKDFLKRIEEIQKLDEATKQHLFFLIDNVIQNYKARKAFDK